MPDTVANGSVVEFSATVHPALFDAETRITRVTADLSKMGGPVAVPLADLGDGRYRLTTSFSVQSPSGWSNVSVLIEEQTSLGPYWIRLSKGIVVLPDGDLSILDEGLAAGWRIESVRGVDSIDQGQSNIVFRGATATAFQVTPENLQRPWRINLLVDVPVDTLALTSLRFAWHRGNTQFSIIKRFDVCINGATCAQLPKDGLINLGHNDWQMVEIPLGHLADGAIRSINLTGSITGTFYLDDMRLIATPPPATTAVLEQQITGQPNVFTLAQNYPNPFNNSTVIRFALPQSGDVELTVYNLAGQKVANLADGLRQAGSYAINWDGKDDGGRVLASGIYFYKLQTEMREETRKLLLLR